MLFRRLLCALLGAALALGLGRPSAAGAAEAEPDLIAFGAGYYDLLQRDDEAADFRIEYRSGRALWILRPWAGIEVTSDGAVYGLGGLLADIGLGSRWVLTPSAGIGAYHDGGGKDLGHTLEFRSQIELAYRFDNRARLGLAFGHISNASLGDTNPGAEVLTLYYSLPLTWFY